MFIISRMTENAHHNATRFHFLWTRVHYKYFLWTIDIRGTRIAVSATFAAYVLFLNFEVHIFDWMMHTFVINETFRYFFRSYRYEMFICRYDNRNGWCCWLRDGCFQEEELHEESVSCLHIRCKLMSHGIEVKDHTCDYVTHSGGRNIRLYMFQADTSRHDVKAIINEKIEIKQMY